MNLVVDKRPFINFKYKVVQKWGEDPQATSRLQGCDPDWINSY